MRKENFLKSMAVIFVSLLGGCYPTLRELQSDNIRRTFVMPREKGCHTGVWIPVGDGSTDQGVYKTETTKAGPDCRPIVGTSADIMCYEWLEKGISKGWFGEACTLNN